MIMIINKARGYDLAFRINRDIPLKGRGIGERIDSPIMDRETCLKRWIARSIQELATLDHNVRWHTVLNPQMRLSHLFDLIDHMAAYCVAVSRHQTDRYNFGQLITIEFGTSHFHEYNIPDQETI